MSDNDLLPEAQTGSSEQRAAVTKGWRGVVTARTFAVVITLAALVAGLFLAGKLGLGSSVPLGIGLVVLVILGHSFMHGGHGGSGGHDAHGSRRAPLAGSDDTGGSPESHRGHFGRH